MSRSTKYGLIGMAAYGGAVFCLCEVNPLLAVAALLIFEAVLCARKLGKDF